MIINLGRQSVERVVGHDHELLGRKELDDEEEGRHLGLVDVEARLGDAEEGVRWRDPHQADVVALQDVARVHVLLVTPHKVTELGSGIAFKPRNP